MHAKTMTVFCVALIAAVSLFIGVCRAQQFTPSETQENLNDLYQPDQSAPQANVLMASRFRYRPFLSDKMRDILDAKGFKVITSLDWIETLDWQTLRNYNTLVLIHHPRFALPEQVDLFKKKRPLLYRYLEQGGSILIFADEYYYTPAQGTHRTLNLFLEPLGLSLMSQPVYDIPEKILVPKEMPYEPTGSIEYSETTNITSGHPITEGVDTLYIPISTNVGRLAEGSVSTTSFTTDGSWQILVRASDTAYTTAGVENMDEKGPIPSAPPVLAAKTVGKGRIVVFTSWSYYWMGDPWYETFDGFALDHGDGMQLVENILGWLAAPSLESKRFGGVPVVQETLPENYTDGSSRWLPADQQPITGKPYKGIMGAFTTYSGGEYTVKDFCDKAKELGYSFIVFTDIIEKLSVEDWNNLAADCKKESTGDFIAIPGVWMDNLSTGRFDMSKKDWNMVDEQIPGRYDLGPPAYCFNMYRMIDRDKEDLDWGYGHALLFQLDFPNVVIAQPSANPKHLSQTIMWQDLEIFSYKGDELIASAVDDWKWALSNTFNAQPMVSHRLWSPDEMQNLDDHFHTYVVADSVEDIPSSYKVTGMAKGTINRIKRSFVSNGPMINRFWFSGPSRLATFWSDFYSWAPGEVMQIHLDVSSDAPITNVELYGRRNPYEPLRIFHPNKKHFTVTVDELRAQSGEYFMIVKDAEGKTAYSSPLSYPHEVFNTPAPEGREYMQGYALRRDLDRLYYNLYGLGNVEDFGSYGGQGYWVGFGKNPILSADEYLVHRIRGRFASADYAFEDMNFYAARGAKDWKQPITTVAGKRRAGTVAAYDKDFSYYELETDMKIVEDAAITPSDDLEVMHWSVYPKKPHTFDKLVYISPDGKKDVPFSKENPTHSGTIAGGGYITLIDPQWGGLGFFSLDDKPLDFTTSAGSSGKIFIGENFDGDVIPAGTPIKSRVLVVFVESKYHPEQFFDNFRDVFGLDGTPGYNVTVDNGTLQSTIYNLKLQAANNYATGAISGVDLPGRMPVMVEGVNDAWDSAIVDLDTGKVTRIGSVESTAYYTLPKDKDMRFFIGNLLTSDDNDVRLSMLDYKDGIATVAVHNPTEAAKTITVATPMEFKLLWNPLIQRSATATQRAEAKKQERVVSVPKMDVTVTVDAGATLKFFGYDRFGVISNAAVSDCAESTNSFTYVSTGNDTEGVMRTETVIVPKDVTVKEVSVDGTPVKFSQSGNEVPVTLSGTSTVTIAY